MRAGEHVVAMKQTLLSGEYGTRTRTGGETMKQIGRWM